MQMTYPIYEPEFAFLPFACECGARFLTEDDVALHKRETCWRRANSDYKQPAPLEPFALAGQGGVADGGRRT